MNITDILKQVGGLQSMAKELGLSESQVAAGASALAPAVLGGFQKQAQSGGVEGLGGLLSQLGGGALLDNVVSAQPTDTSLGNNVLGQIFGSKDVSRTVAQSAAATSGLDAGVLKKMLPMLAMVVAGYMAKGGGAAPAAQQASSGGGLGGLLGGLLGGMGGGGGQRAGGLAGMIDSNGDGNALDDIMRMAGKMIR
ncbi:MAG: DUF937 domain-containing protein [Gemmatimonadaceae bacterium]|nr:DUF937 domain-containing protein [Gemmatimonadaceae bacterium]